MSDQNTVHLVDENAFGEAYVEAEFMLKVLKAKGLKIEAASMCRASAVRFVGVIRGIQVTLNAHLVKKLSAKEWAMGDWGMLGLTRIAGTSYAYVRSYHPQDIGAGTHFKLTGYLPESVHLKGKGRDKLAWEIYHELATALNMREP